MTMIVGTEFDEPEPKIIRLEDGTYAPGGDETYANLSVVMQFYLFTFQNSMGAMMTPAYERWSGMIESDTDPKLAYTMISLTWFIWLFVIIFNVIVLLNFLIAFISETYEEVYGRGRIDDFKNMAQLNHECQVILNALSVFKKAS